MNRQLLLAILVLCRISTAVAQQRPALQAWKDQKYSMFIHWGAIYSTLGGMWEGQKVTRGYSEQIRAHFGGIYSDNYAAVAKRFHPQFWNPDSIVLLAKAAGMKSIVITSKHHDGFCMFRSAYTSFNVVDATPYKRDVIKELAEACKRHGLRLGLYFSLIDWNYPQAWPISSSNSDPITPEHHAYNLRQITELLSNYGPISELWFDMGSLTAEQSNELATLVHRLQPDCMVSGRLGNDAGDFCVMGDNNYPDYKIASPWQTPASVYDETWGYRSWQEHGKMEDKAREKLNGLLKVVSRGGNYLLNIGPRGDGSVVDFERDVLLNIGSWLKINGEAVYGTQPNPFDHTFKWGEITSKPGILYLHLLQMPDSGMIRLNGLYGGIRKVTVLGEHKELRCRIKGTADGTELALPAKFALDGKVKVLKVELGREAEIRPGQALTAGTLTRWNATKHYSISGVDYESYYRSTVAYSWIFKSTGNAPMLLFTEQEKGKAIDVDVNGQKMVIRLDGLQKNSIRDGQHGIQWGPMYANGPMHSRVAMRNGDLRNVDVTKPWPNARGKAWTLMPAWKNGETYEVEADVNEAWYVMQEITSPNMTPYIIRITGGDGVQVFLNGEEQVVHNNPERGAVQQEYLLLMLAEGKNQLVVKFYNRFAARTVLGIDKDIPQELYYQILPVQLRTGDNINRCHIQLHQPVSPHRDMRLPGLMIRL